MTNETKGMLLGLLGVSAFGLTLPAVKVIVPYLDPIFIGLGRAALAAIFAAVFLLWFRQPLPNKTQFVHLSIVALGVVVGFPVFSSWAMLYLPAYHGGVVLGILPLATAIIGVIIGPEKPSLAFWSVSLFGSVLVVGFALEQGSGQIQLADLALLAAIISAALGYAVGAKLAGDLGSWQVICWALVLAFPFIIVPSLYYAPDSIANFPAPVYAGFIYLAIISQLFAFFLWYKGLAIGGIARVSQIQLLQPFITIFVSTLFLSEVIDLNTL